MMAGMAWAAGMRAIHNIDPAAPDRRPRLAAAAGGAAPRMAITMAVTASGRRPATFYC